VIRAFFAIPGDLATLTGGYGYDRQVLARLAAFGVEAIHLRLPDGFPNPSAQALAQAMAALEQANEHDVLLIDGLAYGVLPAAQLSALRAPIVALVHHPLGLESGLTAAQSAELIASERAALSRARHVVVTSETTRDTLVADFRVPLAQISVAVPGTARTPRATGSGSAAVSILAVGSLVPRKAYDVLVQALAGLVDLPWHLNIVGSPDRAPKAAAALRAQINALGLADRITLMGELDDEALACAYARADLFVLASHYEGYGMVLGEAMAHGLPIVTTTGGAAARTVPDGAALKTPPGDVARLRDALAKALSDGDLRRDLAHAAWLAGQSLPDWDDTTRIVSEALHADARTAT
jgi:glycosyltransferase involved in cell wall biosynthesis